MTASLLIVSTGPFAGKSLVTIGLGRSLQDAGQTIAFMKPLGTSPTVRDGSLTDEDALFVTEALGLREPPSIICPVILDRERRLDLLEGGTIDAEAAIMSAHRTLAAGADVVLVGGAARIEDGLAIGVGGERLAEMLDAHVILVDRGGDPDGLDVLLASAARFPARLLGIIINRVPPAGRQVVEKLVVPFLRGRGHAVLGVVPQDDALEYLTVGELADLLGGEIISGQDGAGRYVERFAIGAMRMESALHYFRRMANKGVITGGDRADLQLAALETSTRCLILTGGFHPPQQILNKAAERGVSIIVVKDDTLTTVERIETCLSRLRLRGDVKVQRACELVASTCDIPAIVRALNLK